MNTMAYHYNYAQEEVRNCKTQGFFEPAIYSQNEPLFTEQELCGFEPAFQNIYEDGMSMLAEQMAPQQSGWAQSQMAKPQYMDMEAGYMGYGGEYAEASNMFMGTPDFYNNSSDCFAASCQGSPVYNTTPSYGSTFADYSHPVSPITPSGSPPQYDMNHSAFLMVPTTNGQYYQVPVAAETFVASSNQPTYEEPRQEEEGGKEDEEDEEEDEEKVRLPNHGNKELRGMGLYDDVPDLTWDDGLSTPGCSPVTSHDQIRPFFGKGLVLEKSFGLPEEMMIKDEVSGRIIKGKLDVEEDY